MKKAVIILVFVLALMEGVSWWANKSLVSEDIGSNEASFSERMRIALLPSNVTNNAEEKKLQVSQNDINKEKTVPSIPSVSDSGDFPSPSTEVVDGVTERTIHIGVRQWAWNPDTITAKQGELVRLIIHNADVKHGIVIPELGVNEDISEDGAVVTFEATKKGTFGFLCSVYCGVGHAEMQGKIIIE